MNDGVQVFADDPDSPETWGQERDGLTDAEREVERQALMWLKIDDAVQQSFSVPSTVKGGEQWRQVRN